MSWFHRSSPRRDEIRRARRESTPPKRFVRDRDAITSLAIAGAFLLVVSAIMMLRPEVVPYRPGQFVPHDIVSRVNFVYNNPDLYAAAQQAARDAEPRIYAQHDDVWKRIRDELIALPRRVANLTPEQLDPSLRPIIDGATLVKLQEIAAAQPQTAWDESVDGYIDAIRKLDLVILPADEREEDLGRMIRIPGRGPIRTENTLSLASRDDLAVKFTKPATDGFSNLLFPKVVQLTIHWLEPTHTLDEGATVEARNTASNRISPETGNELKRANTTLVRRGDISQNEWRLLRAEHQAFRQQMTGGAWREHLGAVGIVLLLTIALCGYIARYQPRIIRNHARAVGVAALLVAMLLLAQLAGIGSSQLYI
ncbi:MAG TPA: hypothetical protein PKB10_12325, partial [Tepidisphaeraceae bacterium]|nr:hypothetical protein [Tepidisphaeraceae bacterium]